MGHGQEALADQTVVEARMKLTINCKTYEVELQPDAVVVEGTSFKTAVLRDDGTVTVKVGGRPYKVKVKDDTSVVVDGRPYSVEMIGRAAVARPATKAIKPLQTSGIYSEDGAVYAPMPGRVLALRAQEGQQVDCGTVLLIVEAMKMENEIKASHAGIVKRIAVAPGQNVCNGDVLAVVE